MADPAKVSEEYVQGLMQAGQSVVHQFADALTTMARQSPPSFGPSVLTQPFAGAAEMQQKYLEQIQNFWKSAMGWQVDREAPAKKPDPRFRSADWQHPAYDVLRQSYLAGAKLMNDIVNNAAVDEKTRMHLLFYARQYVDALSPANYLATNPEAIRLAIETKGESLAAGLRNLIEDIRKGRISTTNETAFEVGGNLAVTPGAVVYENELIQLIEYAPLTDKVEKHPLLIIPPAINRFYILDLQPESSFVRYALEQGNTVFLVSWRSATPEIGHLTWDDYLELGIMTPIDVVRDIAKVDKVHMLGFCVGGTLLGCAAAVLKAKNEDKLLSLTFLTTMLEFTDTGEIGIMIDEPYVRGREMMLGRGGVLPGKELGFVFSTLRANDLVWPYVVNNYLKGATPDAFDILYWNADSTNLAGPMYCWYIRNTYLENNIRVPGKTVQCGVPVDLSRIDVPVYIFAAREDHIVPWRTAYATAGLVGGDVRFTLGASGHIAGVINPPARKKRSHWIDGRLGSDPDEWLASAQELPGSWWPDWSQWLKGQATRAVPARKKLGSSRYRPIEPAPGRYVKERDI